VSKVSPARECTAQIARQDKARVPAFAKS
jgi:hypothetical protein